MTPLWRSTALSLVASALVLYGGPAQARVEGELRFDLGYRSADLDWSIAGIETNVLSELTYSDLQILQLRAAGEISIARRWVGTAGVAFGEMLDGDNRDSDYAADDRMDEWSRSENSADGDHVIDASAAVGFRFFAGERRRHKITPLVGLSYSEQKLRATDGNQTLSDPALAPPGITPAPLGRFPGLDSTYETNWFGPWLGIDAELPVGERQHVSIRGEYHWADYEAEADWNLRADLEHPKSFAHEADGTATVVSFLWSLGRSNVGLDYERWSTDPGAHVTYFADGTSAATRLNKVRWDSVSLWYGFSLIHRDRQWSPKPPEPAATTD